MYKILFVWLALIFSANAFSETLNSDMVKQIHDQVKTSFFDGCAKDLKGTAIDICHCLADKTQANLD